MRSKEIENERQADRQQDKRGDRDHQKKVIKTRTKEKEREIFPTSWLLNRQTVD